MNAVACVLAATMACGGDGGSLGPCFIGYDEPLFTIASAIDATSGALITPIILRDFVFDGPPGVRPGMSFLTDYLGLHPRNVEPRDDQLICAVACAFGARPGDYTFTFGAHGYRDTTFAIADANFTKGRGNCPAYLSGGPVLNLRLSPE